jgi:hypothetical protein
LKIFVYISADTAVIDQYRVFILFFARVAGRITHPMIIFVVAFHAKADGLER